VRAGTCLHEILEEVDFAHLTSAPEITAQHLRAYGIEGFDDIVTGSVNQLATLPLSNGKDRFSLRDVPNDSRKAELEFSFPIHSLTTTKLAAAFALEQIPLQIGRLQFQPINGFMNGFIDLIFEENGRFYFIDWKSNWLGSTTAAYLPATLAAEMQGNFYTLQLCLYSVALHRYLRLRKTNYDFDRHFGGAFYIFLRGIDPEHPENGVHFGAVEPRLCRETQRDFRFMNDETDFSALDRQFGVFLQRLARAGADEARLAGMCASRGRAEGHICVPLEEIVKLEKALTPTKLKKTLRASGVVGAPEDFTPLVLDKKNRLYLRRYFEYEQQLAQALLRRAAGDHSTGASNETDLAKARRRSSCREQLYCNHWRSWHRQDLDGDGHPHASSEGVERRKLTHCAGRTHWQSRRAPDGISP
jgi:hypothetical protein